ncbi:MAG: hypothetical protein IPP47_17195 [Bryobacterales bacterium]|nr:hypothetical protein [Bryobacterales bacterium]
MRLERTEESAVPDNSSGASTKPDAYLITATAEQTGGIDRDRLGEWLHPEAHLISFSECGQDQELLLVMPAYGWLRGRLGTFFLEPVAQAPWKARLMLSI